MSGPRTIGEIIDDLFSFIIPPAQSPRCEGCLGTGREYRSMLPCEVCGGKRLLSEEPIDLEGFTSVDISRWRKEYSPNFVITPVIPEIKQLEIPDVGDLFN